MIILLLIFSIVYSYSKCISDTIEMRATLVSIEPEDSIQTDINNEILDFANGESSIHSTFDKEFGFTSQQYDDDMESDYYSFSWIDE